MGRVDHPAHPFFGALADKDAATCGKQDVSLGLYKAGGHHVAGLQAGRDLGVDPILQTDLDNANAGLAVG